MIRLPEQTEDTKDVCPKCGSDSNLAVGNILLRCGNCGWSHLNDRPCTQCGKPSVCRCSGSNGKGQSYTYYGCPDHPITPEILCNAFAGIGEGILRNQNAK